MIAPLVSGLVLLVAAVVAWPLVGLTVTRPATLAGEMPPAQAQALLQVLLKNVYRAFDFREEEDVYDKLAFSVSGDLLSDIYLQNRKSFSIQKAGEAQAKISLSRSRRRLLNGWMTARWPMLSRVAGRRRVRWATGAMCTPAATATMPL